jgi:hypothetical protein
MKYFQKKLLLVTTFALLSLSIGCQLKSENPTDLKEKIIQLDQSGWEAWKNKNGNWFAENTTQDFISISADGISTREQVIAATNSDCEVEGYTLSPMKFTLLSDQSALLTYTVEQDGTCGGIKLHSKIRVAANYILQKDSWLEAFYMESKID